MYVCGFTIQNRSPPATASATSAPNLRSVKPAPVSRATSSATRNPTLCRVRA